MSPRWNRLVFPIVGGMVLGALGLPGTSGPFAASVARAAVFVVDTTLDTSDGDPDGWCSTLIDESVTVCSLREAILEANASTELDVIEFAIGEGGIETIALDSEFGPLPTITDAVIIDGRTEDGWTERPLVTIDGSALSAPAVGLLLGEGSTGSEIYALAITGFPQDGIQISSSSEGNHFQGNDIFGNAQHGIFVVASAGNTFVDNRIGTSDGFVAAPNGGSGMLVSGTNNTIEDNLLSGNDGAGIQVFGPDTDNTGIYGNLIGLTADGSESVPNGGGGIVIQARNTTVGGQGGEGNVISGNSPKVSGITVSGADAAGTSIVGNLIGLNAAGTAAISNDGTGVRVLSVDATTVETPSIIEGNVISGNDGFGVQLNDAHGWLVEANLIGTNAAGDAAIGNVATGITVQSSSSNQIRGNVVSGNSSGILVGGLTTSTPAVGNVIAANYVGLDVTGTGVVGNSFQGIALQGGSSDNVVGGPEPADANVVSGNGTGIEISAGVTGFQTSGNEIRGNLIGLDASGEVALGNNLEGIDVATGGGSVTDNLIVGNTITASGGVGVLVRGGNTDDVAIIGNRIFENASLGIDLLAPTESVGSVTANDEGDGDTGPNGLQNFPVIAQAFDAEGTLTLVGDLDSAPGKYLVEVFASPSCDPSGHGEGAALLSSESVSVGTDDVAPDSFTLTGIPLPASGSFLTTTATEDLGDGIHGATSEFSSCVVFDDGDGEVGEGDLTLTAAAVEPAGTPWQVEALGFIPFEEIDPLAGLRDGASDPVDTGTAISSIGTAISSIGTPIASIDLQSIGTAISSIGTPISSIGTAISSIGTPISSIPITDPNAGTWEERLQGSVYEGVPLQVITLGELFDNAPDVLAGLTLAQLDLSRTEIASLSLLSLTLGNLTLGQAGLTGASVCDGCTNDTPIVDADLSGADMVAIGTAIASIPVSDVVLSAQPIGSITIGSIGTAISSIYLDLIFDCSMVDCSAASTVTLAEAQVQGAIEGSLTLGELYMLILPVESYDWTTLDIASLDLGVGPLVEYTATFSSVTGDEAASLDVFLPSGIRYVEGFSSVVECDATGEVCGTPAPLVDPTPTESGLEWSLSTNSESVYEVRFLGRVGVVALGTYRASATVSVGEDSAFVSDTAPITVLENFEDNGPSTPTDIGSDGLYVSYLAVSGDEDYYRFTVPDGTLATVVLSHLDDDFDLLYFEPVSADASDRTTSEFGPSTPPVDDEGRHLDPNGTLDPEAADDVDLASVGTAISSIGTAISSIGTAISSISTNRGTEDETVSGSGDGVTAAIRVAGFNGESSQHPYVTQIRLRNRVDVVCPPRSLAPGGTGSIPAIPTDADTFILWNAQRIQALYGTAGRNAVEQSLAELVTALTGGDVGAGIPDLSGLGLHPVVIPVDGEAAVRAAYDEWDQNPCSVDGANSVVAAINGLVDDLASDLGGGASQITSITIVGDDDVIPYERRPDGTLISNERDYAAAVLNTASSEQSGIFGALSAGYVLSDDAYAAFTSIFDWIDHELYLPDVAIGRLVETPVEIVASLTQYVAAGGALDPDSAITDFDALVTGYDFLNDGAVAQAGGLDDAYGLGATDLLTDDSTPAWNSEDLADRLFPETGVPNVVGLGAHFDHDELIPADIGTFTSTGGAAANFSTGDLDPALAAGLAGRVIFSVGCHSGLNVPDGLTLPGGGTTADWAQVLGGFGAVFVGNTGFGYGLDGAVGLSEELMAELAARLDGSLTVGDALADAKRWYFGHSLVHGAYSEKILAEATLYGLPFWQLVDGAPTGRPMPPEPPTGPVSIAPTHTPTTVGNGTYYQTDGESTDLHHRPIQPQSTFSYLTTDGTRVTGVMIRALDTKDLTPFDVAYARPIFDLSERESELETDGTIFPNVFASVNSYETRDGTISNVVLATGQFIGEGPGSQRLFTDITFEPLLGSAGGPAPEIVSAEAVASNPSVNFRVEVNGPADEVTVLYKPAGLDSAPTTWTEVGLTEGPAGLWTATESFPDENIEWFAQVRRGSLVGSSYNKGVLFSARLLDAGPDATVSAGDTFVLTDARFVDPLGSGPYSATVDWGDGTGIEIATVDPVSGSDAFSISASHVFDLDGEFLVEVCVEGLASGSACDDLIVTVTPSFGLGPILGAPADPVAVPADVALSVQITDPDGATADQFAATWDWGDGTVTTGTIADDLLVTGEHTYSAAGVYPVTVTVTKGFQQVSRTHEFIVVYDPEGGFVTGGGWIVSPAGSYTADPDLIGVANFGFVSRYKKGKSTPDGSTTFKFRAANLEFKSTSYEWLVISGHRAQFKGEGTINGGGAYGFMLTASDADVTPSLEVDRFRIKIWDLETEEIVYDNQLGESDTAEPTTEVGGGSITIHDGK